MLAITKLNHDYTHLREHAPYHLRRPLDRRYEGQLLGVLHPVADHATHPLQGGGEVEPLQRAQGGHGFAFFRGHGPSLGDAPLHEDKYLLIESASKINGNKS